MCSSKFIDCFTVVEDSPFRTIDGRCNNVGSGKELWGSMSIPMRRYLPSIVNIYTVPTYLDAEDTTVADAAAGSAIDGTYVGESEEVSYSSIR